MYTGIGFYSLLGTCVSDTRAKPSTSIMVDGMHAEKSTNYQYRAKRLLMQVKEVKEPEGRYRCTKSMMTGALLVLNETALNINNALLALSQRLTIIFFYQFSSLTQGYYLNSDATGQSKRDKALIQSPYESASVPKCVQFWYFMLGSQMGTLR